MGSHSVQVPVLLHRHEVLGKDIPGEETLSVKAQNWKRVNGPLLGKNSNLTEDGKSNKIPKAMTSTQGGWLVITLQLPKADNGTVDQSKRVCTCQPSRQAGVSAWQHCFPCPMSHKVMQSPRLQLHLEWVAPQLKNSGLRARQLL